jgi:hypothetical protein
MRRVSKWILLFVAVIVAAHEPPKKGAGQTFKQLLPPKEDTLKTKLKIQRDSLSVLLEELEHKLKASDSIVKIIHDETKALKTLNTAIEHKINSIKKHHK